MFMATTVTTAATTTASTTVASPPTAAVTIAAVLVAADSEHASLLVVLILLQGGQPHDRGAEFVGCPQALHQLRHHLRKKLTLSGVLRIKFHAASKERRCSSSRSSRRAWGSFITAITSSQVKALRAECAMYATLPCRNNRSPGLLLCPVAGSEVPGAGPRRAAGATDCAGVAGLVVFVRPCSAAASSRLRFATSPRARWSVSGACAVLSPTDVAAACASVTVSKCYVSSASAVARASTVAFTGVGRETHPASAVGAEIRAGFAQTCCCDCLGCCRCWCWRHNRA